VIPSLKRIAWHNFLVRPTLESPPLEVLRTISNIPMLITGAGGSIGSALALRLARLGQALFLLESGENNLCELQRAMADDPDVPPHVKKSATFILGSAGDSVTMEELFAVHRPRIIFHAAAYKHVPLLEAQPLAAIRNNIFATEIVTNVAAVCGARVVLLSTDKAVEPASVMGATKRVAEQIVLASGGTVLRLGNVLASSGSATEVFAQQIARGGPLTITDPAARRYFLTLDEAVNLLLFASVHPCSALLAPAQLNPSDITELAGFMARELAPGRELPVQYTGLRPGDKLTERLWNSSDLVRPTATGGLVSIRSDQPTQSQLKSGLAALHTAVEDSDLSAALTQLRSLVPDFRPSESLLAFARQFGPRVPV
jgi:O-antigen biosynthesis protein WbqV